MSYGGDRGKRPGDLEQTAGHRPEPLAGDTDLGEMSTSRGLPGGAGDADQLPHVWVALPAIFAS